jgi:hypothetical protein
LASKRSAGLVAICGSRARKRRKPQCSAPPSAPMCLAALTSDLKVRRGRSLIPTSYGLRARVVERDRRGGPSLARLPKGLEGCPIEN